MLLYSNIAYVCLVVSRAYLPSDWLERLDPLMTHLCGEITFTKPRCKRLFACISFFRLVCLCCSVFSPGPTQYINLFHTPMAR